LPSSSVLSRLGLDRVDDWYDDWSETPLFVCAIDVSASIPIVSTGEADLVLIEKQGYRKNISITRGNL
jgi:hypothetical protein